MKKRKKKVFKTEKKMDSVYIPSLKLLIDRLFQEAYDRKWTWGEMADQSGLSDATIRKLGNYETRYPMFRTVQLLAYALGGHLEFKEGKKAKVFKISWHVDAFSKQRKAA